MKKFLAVIMALIMSFSVALVPACAADLTKEDVESTVSDVFDAIETSAALIQDTIEHIHNIVGQIMAVLGKECAMCGELHEVKLENNQTEGSTEGEIVEMEKVEMLAA